MSFKTFKEMFSEANISWETFLKKLEEDAEPTNQTGGVANSDSPPMFKMSRFAGIPCVEVDDDTYHKCKFGKKPYARWEGVIEDEALRGFVKKQFDKSPKLMIQNQKTGSTIYLKR